MVEIIKSAGFLKSERKKKCERSSPSLRIKLQGIGEELNIWKSLLVSLCFAPPTIWWLSAETLCWYLAFLEEFEGFCFLGFYDEDGDYNINPSLCVFSCVFSDPFLSRSLSLSWGWVLLCKGTFKDSHHLLVLIRFGYCTFELSN